jgi:hypothetical protein
MIQDFIISTIIPWLISWMQNNPTLAPIIVVLIAVQGFCRLWLKPIMSGIVEFTNWTSSPKDNEFIAKILESKAYKVAAYIVDWFLSIKLPTIEKQPVQLVVPNEILTRDPTQLADDINKLSK